MDEVSAPRNAIKAAAPEFFELDESGKETLCCGEVELFGGKKIAVKEELTC